MADPFAIAADKKKEPIADQAKDTYRRNKVLVRQQSWLTDYLQADKLGWCALYTTVLVGVTYYLDNKEWIDKYTLACF